MCSADIQFFVCVYFLTALDSIKHSPRGHPEITSLCICMVPAIIILHSLNSALVPTSSEQDSNQGYAVLVCPGEALSPPSPVTQKWRDFWVTSRPV